MNNENKEFFNNDVEINVSEEEIVLAPPTELFDEAKEIAQTTVADEKYPFTLQYDANQKDHLQSMLQTVGAVVKEDDEESHLLSTRMNMTQLAFIKRLECVERVRTDEGRNPFLMEEAEQPVTVVETPVETAEPQTAEAMQTEQVMMLAVDESAELIAASADDGIAVACAGGSYNSCNCPTNTNMESAKEIQVESFVSGCICCPGAEQWFKFTVPQTKQYTIYTSGSLDTVGTLYDRCGNYITSVDDVSGNINFRIVRTLTAGVTYYVKVSLADDDTGSYTVRVTETLFVDYVNINKDSITLVKGVTYELPITPNYVYKGYNGAQRIPGLSVSITPANANEQKIWWYESYGNILNCSYGWDDDGDRYIHVTAKENGTAKLYAVDWSENGKRDECTVNVTYWPVYDKPIINYRESWGARDVVSDRLEFRERNPQMIVFHHTADKFSSTNITEIIAQIKETQNEHIDKDGKCDIAYHFVIDPAGGIWQGALIDEYKRGHANGHFDDIGVVLLGDFQSRLANLGFPNTLNDNQKNAMKELSKWLCYEYNLPIDKTSGVSPITTHRAVDSDTVCPGENAATWVENDLNAYINNWHP